MDVAVGDPMSQDRQIAAAVRRERPRLLAFIRRRIDDAAEAEDILQEALYELVAAARLQEPVEQIGAWLTRVARNRIIDRFRKKCPELLEDRSLEELLPPADGTPETDVM